MLSAMRRSGCTMSALRALDSFDEDPASAHTIRPPTATGTATWDLTDDAVKRVQVAASVGRQIGGHAGQHDRLTLQELLRAPRHGVEVVDIGP